jgi:hypothetical protein
MTWIKPSFLWMMYRAGSGFKDEGQRRILAIDIGREGFEWALARSCPSHPKPSMSYQDWTNLKNASPVRPGAAAVLILPFRAFRDATV